jgi:acetyl-CoA carboxylase biotin carboxyl carrier protein
VSLTKKDIDLIQALLEDSQFDRLSLELNGVKVELTRSGARPSTSSGPSTGSGRAEPAGESLVTKSARAEPVEARARQSTEEGLLEIKSPLLGVFYRAPKPGEPPFVEVGDRVEADSAIGIIEVMKLMNSARAGVRGTVVEILAVNGEMVEHGEPLMLVRPD